jgi:predicted ArsR family transcriptional regulator
VNELSRHIDGELLPTDARRAGRAISRYQTGGQVRTAKVDTETDVAMAKADALTAVTGQAMANVVRVAQAHRQLEQLAPEAAGRLAFLADDHLLAMSETVADLRRDLRRK